VRTFPTPTVFLASLVRAAQSGVHGSGPSGCETDILPLRTYQSYRLLCSLIQYYQRDYFQHSGLDLTLHRALTRALDRPIWTDTWPIYQYNSCSIRYATTSSQTYVQTTNLLVTVLVKLRYCHKRLRGAPYKCRWNKGNISYLKYRVASSEHSPERSVGVRIEHIRPF
jgi:hypothetical protein